MVERAGKSFEIWYDSIKGSSTKAQRLGFIEKFLEWQGIGYEDFYKKYHEASRSDDPRDLALMNSTIVNFYKELRDRKSSSGYAKNHVGVVVGFLSENGLTVNFTKNQKKEMARKPMIFKDNWTREEIRQLLAATTSPRNQALIHCLKDTGMAVSDLGDLNVGDLKTAIDNGDHFTVIEYSRNKTEEYGTPCLGYEALDAVKNWLHWRVEHGFNCGYEDPLFIITQAQTGHYRISREELLKGVRMSGEAITGVILKMVKRAGLSDKRLSAHCFRIYNASALESAGVNKNVVYRLQGRVIPDSGKTYSKGEVLSSYTKAYDALAVGPKPQIIEVQDSRVAELEERQKASDARIEKLTRALEAIYEREKVR